MSRTTCPDCEVELQAIKILDATGSPRFEQKGILHVELSYAAPDAESSFWSHTIQREGTVQAKLCPKCGRILLYAVPLKKTLKSLTFYEKIIDWKNSCNCRHIGDSSDDSSSFACQNCTSS